MGNWAIEAYPLAWPTGWKRTARADRKNAQFSKRETQYRDGHSWSNKKYLTVSDGTHRIIAELERMGINRQDVIISTNVPVRLDGLPRSGEREPDDPGAAIYWQAKPGAPMRAMAIDRYTAVADNLAALAATLEAMRAIERHGGAEILDRAFSGFKQLAAENEGPSWWSVLEVPYVAGPDVIEAAYRRLAKVAHPDEPTGSNEVMAMLNAAREEGLRVAKGAR